MHFHKLSMFSVVMIQPTICQTQHSEIKHNMFALNIVNTTNNKNTSYRTSLKTLSFAELT